MHRRLIDGLIGSMAVILACGGASTPGGDDRSASDLVSADPNPAEAFGEFPESAEDAAEGADEARDVGPEVPEIFPDVTDASLDTPDASGDTPDADPDAVPDAAPDLPEADPDVSEAGEAAPDPDPDAPDGLPDTPDAGDDTPDAPDAGPAISAALCRPCATDEDCDDGRGSPASCVDYAGEGRFCAPPCSGSCPDGYDCAPLPGGNGTGCLHASGTCACSPDSIAEGRWTPCRIANQHGTCPGRRTCTQAGLSACDAAIPAAETCDGTDQDCEGTTDQGTCDDGIDCTQDRCDSTVPACVHAVPSGSCLVDGACVSRGAVHPSDPCRACDPDRNNAGWSPNDGAACSDDDRCTTDDRCADGACQGTSVSCPTRPPECAAGASRAFGAGICDPADGSCVHPAVDTPCPAGCDDATGLCRPDPCADVVCDTPPDPCHQGTGTCSGGTCSYLPVPTPDPCEDGNPCTIEDRCDGSGACVPGPEKPCPPPPPYCLDDGLVIGTASCDPADGGCDLHEETTPCPHGCDPVVPACRPDPCLGVTCDTPPSPICWEPTGTCSGGTCDYPPLIAGTGCDDGNPCTIDDRCDGEGNCISGAPATCTPPAPFCRGDDHVTTRSACDPLTGLCDATETVVPCPFGCDPVAATCRPDPCEGVACDSPPTACHETSGSCSVGTCSYPVRLPGSPCDDTDTCTVDDRCDAAQSCAGTPRVCVPPPPSCSPDGSSIRQSGGTCLPVVGCTYTPFATPCAGGCDTLTGLCNAVVVSQFRTRSGSTGTDEFVELFNAGGVAVDISGWKLWGSNSTGSAVSVRATVPAGTVMPPRSFFLFASVPANPPTPGYTGPVPGDVTYSTGITDNGGISIVTTTGVVVDRVGMSATTPYLEGSPLTPLVAGATSPGYLRRSLGCGPDQDTGDNAADFEWIPETLPRNRSSCRPACAGTRCDAVPDACTDAFTLTTWTVACGDLQQCQASGQPVPCTFGCDAAAAACRIDLCPGQADGTPCSDGDACTEDDACLAGACTPGTPRSCNDDSDCTADNCSPATGCVFTPQPCCGNHDIDPGEECDDGNKVGGDGCSATCQSDCPDGTVLEAGYCWVLATSADETHAQACARIDRAPTPPEVVLAWDAAALARVATGLGYSSAGDDGDFSPAMWCDAFAMTCDTHAFGTAFFNYGRLAPASAARPVFTCALVSGPPVPLPTLTVHFVEMGELGDAILLDAGTTEIVIDGGEFGSTLATYIQPYVDGPIEVVVASHPHTDHYGGLVDVLALYPVQEVWLNGDRAANAQWTQFWDAILARQAAGAVLRDVNSTRTASAGGLGFTVMHPGPVLSGDTNADSLVMKLVHGSVGFVFTGDSLVAGESSILAAGYDPRAQILKLAHHGSRTSNSTAWLQAVAPALAVYQTVLDNPYGHPHEEIITRLQSLGIPVMGTDTRGTIQVSTDGWTYTVTTAR